MFRTLTLTMDVDWVWLQAGFCSVRRRVHSGRTGVEGALSVEGEGLAVPTLVCGWGCDAGDGLRLWCWRRGGSCFFVMVLAPVHRVCSSVEWWMRGWEEQGRSRAP
eukprot:302082-Chlamydomonas_euryale.AAC.1